MGIIGGSVLFSEATAFVPADVIVNNAVQTVFLRGHISKNALKGQIISAHITGLKTVEPVTIVGDLPNWGRDYNIGPQPDYMGDGGGKG